MRGYVIRVMKLGDAFHKPRETEIITPKEKLTDLILEIGRLPKRSAYWDVFYVEGDPIPNLKAVLDEDHVALDGVQIIVKYNLMHGSLVLTDDGFTLYQNFSTGKGSDIPF